MAPKKTRKPIHETMVEEPTEDFDVPFEAIREEEQESYEEREDRDIHNDHGNEEEQPTIILFTPKQLEALLKMDRLDFI